MHVQTLNRVSGDTTRSNTALTNHHHQQQQLWQMQSFDGEARSMQLLNVYTMVLFLQSRHNDW